MNRYPDYHRAVRLAYRTLLHLKIAQLPVDIVSICRKCKNTVIIPYSEAEPYADILGLDLQFDAPSEMAYTYRIEMPDGSIIHLLLYNDEPYQNAYRFRFTLAHELGHIVMKHRDSGYVQEAEANCFAQHLLCPEPLVEALRENANEWLLSSSFGVSRSTARIILQEGNRDFHTSSADRESLRILFGLNTSGPGVITQKVFERVVSFHERNLRKVDFI